MKLWACSLLLMFLCNFTYMVTYNVHTFPVLSVLVLVFKGMKIVVVRGVSLSAPRFFMEIILVTVIDLFINQTASCRFVQLNILL